MTDNGFVIVGGGLAAGSAAEELRAQGYEGAITVIAAEDHRPYIRPPLSKGYLAGSDELESVFVHPEGWEAENRVTLRTGSSVSALDPGAHRLVLDGGERLAYDRVLLATGASPRRLGLPGEQLHGVHHLRTIEDSTALRDDLKDGGRRVVVIGSGWIGLEVAATARTLKNEVTVVQRGMTPLESALGSELGRMFGELHERNGVTFRSFATVQAVVGDGRATGVMVDGETIPADVVVIGAGAVPNTALAEAAGIAVDDGILVDAALATDAPDVYAAGDVANPIHPVLGERLRSEHWANALNGGAAAARSMLGQEVSYDAIPYFYTDQYDLGMEYSGYAPLAADAVVVYRGDRHGGEFIAFWVAQERVVAGMNVNVWDVNDAVQQLIRSGRTVDIARLTDETVPLESV